ncbi:unnamed protein product [Linum trigynum]|uniref:Uncharacterized protein n=1 Tax=Linum trigynum TaxID=586398 RepID=A0AAV2CAP7_9ROSI
MYHTRRPSSLARTPSTALLPSPPLSHNLPSLACPLSLSLSFPEAVAPSMDAPVLDRDLPDDDDSPGTFESSSDVADGGAGQGNSIWDARQFNGQFPPPIQWTIPPPIRSTIPLPIQWMLVFQIGTAPTTTIPPATSESSSDVADGGAGQGNSICCIPESSLVVCALRFGSYLHSC